MLILHSSAYKTRTYIHHQHFFRLAILWLTFLVTQTRATQAKILTNRYYEYHYIFCTFEHKCKFIICEQMNIGKYKIQLYIFFNVLHDEIPTMLYLRTNRNVFRLCFNKLTD